MLPEMPMYRSPATTTSWDQVRERLHERGLRWTPQRRLLIDVLLRTDGHITGAELVERCRAEDPETTPSTVYRTLDVLEDIGLIRHAHGLDGREEFHVRPAREHGHLHCSVCHRAWEIEADEVRRPGEGLPGGTRLPGGPRPPQRGGRLLATAATSGRASTAGGRRGPREPRILSQRALNRALLARQLLLERSPLDLAGAVEQVGGLQAQYAPSAYVGLWTRVAGFRGRT